MHTIVHTHSNITDNTWRQRLIPRAEDRAKLIKGLPSRRFMNPGIMRHTYIPALRGRSRRSRSL